MFFVQFYSLFSKKIFSADFRPNFGLKLGYMSKCRLKNRPNHMNTKWPGGFAVMRYYMLILGEKGLEHILGTQRKPFGHALYRHGRIDMESVGKIAFLAILGLFLVYWLWEGRFSKDLRWCLTGSICDCSLWWLHLGRVLEHRKRSRGPCRSTSHAARPLPAD